MDARSPRPSSDYEQGQSAHCVFFLAETHDDEAAFGNLISSAGTERDLGPPIGIQQPFGSPIADVLALEGVQRSGQELAADPVASREVRERLQAARTTERDVLNGLIGNPTLSDWFWRSEPLRDIGSPQAPTCAFRRDGPRLLRCADHSQRADQPQPPLVLKLPPRGTSCSSTCSPNRPSPIWTFRSIRPNVRSIDQC